MPLHIPSYSLTRRTLLSRLLQATGAAAAARVCGSSLAETLSKEGDKIEAWALFSDTHIVADVAMNARGINMADHFRQSLNEALSAHRERPFSGLMVNGDCAYLDGQSADYATFASLLERVSAKGIPIHVTLGNHDHRDHIKSGLDSYIGAGSVSAKSGKMERGVIAEKLASRVTGRFCDWYLLDSLEETNQTPGKIGDEQIKWLDEQLKRSPDRAALVMVHHNPQPPGLGKVSGLLDTEPLLSLLLERKQVKALFFGHTHVAKTVELGGLHLVNLPACAYRFSEAQPTGWTAALVDQTGCTLTLFDTEKKHALHEKPTRLDWRS